MWHGDADSYLHAETVITVSGAVVYQRHYPPRLVGWFVYKTQGAALFTSLTDMDTGEIVEDEKTWIPFSCIDRMLSVAEDEEETADTIESILSPAFDEPPRPRPVFRIVPRDDPEPEPPMPALFYEPVRLPRTEIAGTVEVGSAELRVDAAGVQVAWPDADGFPRYLKLSDDEIPDLALAGYLACVMLDQAAEVRPMAITLNQLNKTLAVAHRFMEAAGAAEQVLKQSTGNPDHTPITGSKETAALRRASLDLTRALADLRRPQ